MVLFLSPFVKKCRYYTCIKHNVCLQSNEGSAEFLRSLADVHSCERYHDEAIFFNYLFPAIATVVEC